MAERCCCHTCPECRDDHAQAVLRAIDEGYISAERAFIGLRDNDVAALACNGYENVLLNVHLRGPNFDATRVMTIAQLYHAPTEIQELVRTVFVAKYRS